MSSKNLGTSDNENSLNSVIDSIKSISSTILSLGFVLYAVGFVVINLRLSKFGAHEISLLEPRYLISGILALFLVLVPLAASLLITISFTSIQLEGSQGYRIIQIGDPKIWKKGEDEAAEFSEKYRSGIPVEIELGKDNYAELKKGFSETLRGMFRYAYGGLKSLILFSFLTFLFYIFAFFLLLVFVLPSYEEAGITVTEVDWATIRDIFLLQLLCLPVIFFPLFNKPFRHVYELLKGRVLVVFFMSLVSIILFANGIFPEIPFVLGGGKPEQVCLGLFDKTSAPIFSPLGITLGSDNFWTEPINLIFEGENSVTILLDDDSSASIKKELIASIHYNCVNNKTP